MEWLRTRFGLLLAVSVVATALVIVQGRAQFGHLIVRFDGNRSMQLKLSAAVGGGTSLPEIRFSGEGFNGEGVSAIIRPDTTPVAGTRVPAQVTLSMGDVIRQGRVLLDVQETGQFLGAEVSGSVSQWNLSGGFRLKLAPAGEANVPVMVMLHRR